MLDVDTLLLVGQPSADVFRWTLGLISETCCHSGSSSGGGKKSKTNGRAVTELSNEDAVVLIDHGGGSIASFQLVTSPL